MLSTQSINGMSITTCTCDICNATWIARTAHPVQCPRCKGVRWNKHGRAVRTVKLTTRPTHVKNET